MYFFSVYIFPNNTHKREREGEKRKKKKERGREITYNIHHFLFDTHTYKKKEGGRRRGEKDGKRDDKWKKGKEEVEGKNVKVRGESGEKNGKM